MSNSNSPSGSFPCAEGTQPTAPPRAIVTQVVQLVTQQLGAAIDQALENQTTQATEAFNVEEARIAAALAQEESRMAEALALTTRPDSSSHGWRMCELRWKQHSHRR